MGAATKHAVKSLRAKVASKRKASRIKHTRLDSVAASGFDKPILQNARPPVTAVAEGASKSSRSSTRSYVQGIPFLRATQQVRLKSLRPTPPSTVQGDRGLRLRPAVQAQLRRLQRPNICLQTSDPTQRALSPRGIQKTSKRRGWRLRTGNRTRESIPKTNGGDMALLRSLLSKNVTLFAIDTEFKKRGICTYVTEVGITMLRTEDIRGVEPGLFAEAWFRKATHHHIVIDVLDGELPTARSYFCESILRDSNGAKNALLEIMKSCKSAEGPRNLALIGHSLLSDIAAMMRCPGLRTDLTRTGIEGLSIDAHFDTFELGQEARLAGGYLPSLKLGSLVRGLGIHPKYHRGTDVFGTHNASNDAAYTMFCVLLLAVNWKQIVQGANFEGLASQLAAQFEGARSPPQVAGLSVGNLRQLLEERRKHREQIRELNRLPKPMPPSSSQDPESYMQWLSRAVGSILPWRV